MDIRALDPTTCTVRHIRRGVAGDATAKQVGRVYFIRQDTETGQDGLNGEQGWQQAKNTLVLSDDGSFSLVLPNIAGGDGVLHLERFDVLTDPDYEPGEEWLEFWTDADPDTPLFVGTPTDADKGASTITITGTDLTEVLTGCLSTDVDVWDAAGPADILRHYSRLRTLAYGSDTLVALDTDVVPGASHTATFASIDGDCWVAHATLRWITPRTGATPYVQFHVGSGLGLIIYPVGRGDDTIIAATGTDAPDTITGGRRDLLSMPGTIDMRIVAHYDHMFGFVNGELVVEWRRPPELYAAESSVTVQLQSGAAFLDQLHVETLTDFATRGPSATVERRLPGIPPATGLRGRYYDIRQVFDAGSNTDQRLERLWLISKESEPIADRLEETLYLTSVDDYPAAAGPLAWPFAARFTGAVYLDLASSNRVLRLATGGGCARVYVGRTLRGDEASTTWSSGGEGVSPLTTDGLRSWIGESAAGWYPIVIEVYCDAKINIILQDAPADAAGTPTGAWATIPASRLSPIGTFDDTVRLTPHRSTLGDVAAAFGYQWRVEHRSLESGEFPGQLSFAGLLGRQTAKTIQDDSVGSDPRVQVNARDVVDGLYADAAGLADPNGASQLSAQAIDFARANGRLALRQVYESLADITERPLLQTRIDSLLALRGSPNEQVGVTVDGQRDMVDTFPLTGAIAKLDWLPGDGILLDLDRVGVHDQSPRQFTVVEWSPRPNGLGAPQVSFRARPRTPSAALKRLRAAIYAPRRTYQGAVAVLTGSTGNADDFGTLGGAGSDGYSRVPLPHVPGNIVRAFLNVQVLTGGTWALEIGGRVGQTVTQPGRYPITDLIQSADVGSPYAYARLVPVGVPAGEVYLVTLEVHTRI